jgi:hypothetical protein
VGGSGRARQERLWMERTLRINKTMAFPIITTVLAAIVLALAIMT